MHKTCLEVALNGPWSQSLQPLMPTSTKDLVAEGIACARLGAAVIHVHVYNPKTGRQYENYDAYRRVIEGIREEVDVIVYPTLPLSGSVDASEPMSPAERFSAVEALARDGLLEWSVIDPGSTLLAGHSDIAAGESGFLYYNSVDEIRYGLKLATQYSFHPSYAIYEPGFARLGCALARERPGLPKPVYRFMFSDGFTFGFPPRTYALDCYIALLRELDPNAPFMVAGLQVDVLPLIGDAIAKGGHVRVGLEDAPFGSSRDNVSWTEAAVAEIARNGGTLADANDVRAALSATG